MKNFHFFVLAKLLNKINLLMIVICLSIPGVSHAVFIDVLDQQYSIRGEGVVTGPEGIMLYASYNWTSDLPVFHNEGWISYVDAHTGGAFIMDSRAEGEVTSEYARVGVLRNFDNIGNGYILDGFASASLTFFPLVNSMIVFPDIGIGMGARAIIADVTNGELLYSGGFNDPYVIMSFDLSHVYLMSFESTGNYTASRNNFYSLRLEPIPEPNTILLLGTGLLGIAISRIRRKNKRLTPEYRNLSLTVPLKLDNIC